MFLRKDKPFFHQNILAAASTYSHAHPAREGSLESLLRAYQRASREPKEELQIPQNRGPGRPSASRAVVLSEGGHRLLQLVGPAGCRTLPRRPGEFHLSLRPDPGFFVPLPVTLREVFGPISGKIRRHTFDAFPSALSADSVFKDSLLYRKEVGPLDPILCQYNQVGPVSPPPPSPHA